MAKNSKAMKHPLFSYFNIFIMFFCYTNATAQDELHFRFDTYSNLELNGYTEHNTLILTANQDNMALIDKAMLSSLDNLIIRDVCIDDVLLARISKMDISNAQLYNVSGNIDSFFSVFLSMSKAKVLKISNITVDMNFTKHAHWSSIKRLEISNCTIHSISDVIKQMSEVSYISITNSRIDSISFDTILSSLVFLDLSACTLSNIPQSIKNCPNLECFRYYDNYFPKTDCDMLKNNIELDVKVKCIEGGTTQAKVAEIVGTTPSYVSRIVNGGDKVVNKTFVSMMEALGYDVRLVYEEREAAK